MISASQRGMKCSIAAIHKEVGRVKQSEAFDIEGMGIGSQLRNIRALKLLQLWTILQTYAHGLLGKQELDKIEISEGGYIKRKVENEQHRGIRENFTCFIFEIIVNINIFNFTLKLYSN